MTRDAERNNASGAANGALVISLDFELHWGVRERKPVGDPYCDNILGVREALPRTLDLFEKFDAAATWATVGLLFAKDAADAKAFQPTVLPNYERDSLSSYDQPVGDNETDDPLHYGRSLISDISSRSCQEIGTHTFSHYFCLERGQARETFAADIDSSVRIAARDGVETRSLVPPRNQWNPAYTDVLLQAGLTCVRGNDAGWMYAAGSASQLNSRPRRAGRLVDSFVNIAGHRLVDWAEIPQENGLCDVRASHFLRPIMPGKRALNYLRLNRILSSMRQAAKLGRLYHLWWHPHNHGLNVEENMAFLSVLLEEAKRLREKYQFASMTMAEAAAEAVRRRA